MHKRRKPNVPKTIKQSAKDFLEELYYFSNEPTLRRNGIEHSEAIVTKINSGGIFITNSDVPLTHYQRKMLEKIRNEMDHGFDFTGITEETSLVSEPVVLSNLIRHNIHENDRNLVIANIARKQHLNKKIAETEKDIALLSEGSKELRSLPSVWNNDLSPQKKGKGKHLGMSLLQEKQFELEQMMCELKIREESPSLLREGPARLEVRKQSIETQNMELRQRISLKKKMNQITTDQQIEFNSIVKSVLDSNLKNQTENNSPRSLPLNFIGPPKINVNRMKLHKHNFESL